MLCIFFFFLETSWPGSTNEINHLLLLFFSVVEWAQSLSNKLVKKKKKGKKVFPSTWKYKKQKNIQTFVPQNITSHHKNWFIMFWNKLPINYRWGLQDSLYQDFLSKAKECWQLQCSCWALRLFPQLVKKRMKQQADSICSFKFNVKKEWTMHAPNVPCTVCQITTLKVFFQLPVKCERLQRLEQR